MSPSIQAIIERRADEKVPRSNQKSEVTTNWKSINHLNVHFRLSVYVFKKAGLNRDLLPPNVSPRQGITDNKSGA